MIKTTVIKFRRGTTSEWSLANPVLDVSEPGYETNTRKLKIGDGTTRWNSLPYIQGALGDPETQAMVYNQIFPQATWSITHALGRIPSVSVYVDGELVEPDVYSTSEQVTITWPSPAEGVAVLN